MDIEQTTKIFKYYEISYWKLNGTYVYEDMCVCVQELHTKLMWNRDFSEIEIEVIKMSNIEVLPVHGTSDNALNGTALQDYVGLLLFAGIYRLHGKATKKSVRQDRWLLNYSVWYFV